MSEPKRPLKVFLSHAHSDQRVVHELYSRLKKDGVDAWLDKEEIVGGQHFEREIRKAVQDSDIVVVCLSKEFNRAGFRQREVKWALDAAMNQPEGEIFIIPLRLEECDTLDSLRELHWVDYFEDNGYERLMRALRARADRIGATLQVKKKWLSTITVPPFGQKKIDEVKKPKSLEKNLSEESKILPDVELLPNDDTPLPSDKFPDGWESEWQPLTEIEESHLVEIPQGKTGDSLVAPRNRNLYISAGILLVVLILASVFGLPPLIGQPEQTSTVTSTAEMLTAVVSLSKTPVPSVTPSIPTNTKTPTTIPTPMGGGSGKILYVSNGDIYSINSDGTNPINLTNSQIVGRIEALSPDARKIAFSTTSLRDIFIMNIDGTDVVNITGGQGLNNYFAAWLPDSNHIVFRTFEWDFSDIFLVSVDGIEQVKLTPPRAYGDKFDFITLSPDGTTIWLRSLVFGAYTRDPIYSMNINRTNILNLTSTAELDEFIAWSPDGGKVLFSSKGNEASNIFIANADGSDSINLTNVLSDIRNPFFSPTGEKIMFSSNQDGVVDVFIMNIDGAGLIKLTNGQGHSDNASFSPTGQKIVFSSDRDGGPDIFIMNADGSEQINLTTSSEVWDQFCYWSPDGKEILFSSRQNNRDIFYTINTDGAFLTRLVDSGMYAPCPIWLP